MAGRQEDHVRTGPNWQAGGWDPSLEGDASPPDVGWPQGSPKGGRAAPALECSQERAVCEELLGHSGTGQSQRSYPPASLLDSLCLRQGEPPLIPFSPQPPPPHLPTRLKELGVQFQNLWLATV